MLCPAQMLDSMLSIHFGCRGARLFLNAPKLRHLLRPIQLTQRKSPERSPCTLCLLSVLCVWLDLEIACTVHRRSFRPVVSRRIKSTGILACAPAPV